MDGLRQVLSSVTDIAHALLSKPALWSVFGTALMFVLVDTATHTLLIGTVSTIVH